MNNDAYFKIYNKILQLKNKLSTLEPDSEEYNLEFFQLRSFFTFLFDGYLKISKEATADLLKEFEKFDKIYADLVSAVDNANCSCRSRVINFFIENTEETLQIFNRLLTLYPQEELFYKKIISNVHSIMQKYLNRNSQIGSEEKFFLGGEVKEFKTKEDYYKIISEITEKGQYYNGLQVVEREDVSKVYFY